MKKKDNGKINSLFVPSSNPLSNVTTREIEVIPNNNSLFLLIWTKWIILCPLFISFVIEWNHKIIQIKREKPIISFVFLPLVLFSFASYTFNYIPRCVSCFHYIHCCWFWPLPSSYSCLLSFNCKEVAILILSRG